MVYTYLVPQYGAVEHWAKIEVPADPDGRERFRNRIKARSPPLQATALAVHRNPLHPACQSPETWRRPHYFAACAFILGKIPGCGLQCCQEGAGSEEHNGKPHC